MVRISRARTIVIMTLAWCSMATVGDTRADGSVDRTVTVSGEAELRIVPDEVVMTFGVETHDMELTTSRMQNDERVERIFAALAAADIEKKHIKTEYLNIEPRYDSSYSGYKFLGYWTRKTIVVTLRDVDKVESLLSAVLESGATHVHGIDFRTTELRKYRDEARAMAVKAAQEKAGDLLKTLGESLGRVRTLQETGSHWWGWSGYGSWGNRWGGMAMQNVVQSVNGAPMQGDGTIAPGQLAVRATVTATFDIVP